MRWRRGAMAVVAAVVAVFAGCGSPEAGQPEASGGSSPADAAEAAATGFEWTEVRLDEGLGQMLVLGTGFLAERTVIEASGPSDIPVLVTSPDGVTWAEVPDTGLGPDERVATWITSGPWGALGVVGDRYGEVSPGDLLVTRDGSEFARVALPSDAGDGADGPVGVSSAAIGAPGAVVLTRPGQSHSAEVTGALFSADLQTWEQVEVADPASLGESTEASSAGFLVAGQPGQPMQTLGYFSADGRSWQAVPVPDGVEFAAVDQIGRWPGGGFLINAGAFDSENPATDEESSPERVLLASADGQTWSTIDTAPLGGLWPPGGQLASSSLGAMSFGYPADESGMPDEEALQTGGTLFYTAGGVSWQSWAVAELFEPGLQNVNLRMGDEVVIVHPLGTQGPPTSTHYWVGQPTQG